MADVVAGKETLSEGQTTPNLMEEVDDMPASKPLVAPSNTPITGDSGQNSPVIESQHDGSVSLEEKTEETKPTVTEKVAEPKGEKIKSSNPASVKSEPIKESSRNGSAKESKKDRNSNKTKKKEEKKEDKGIEYILRALNSLQTPEEKLAALCKRYADMHEEHRVLQTSFKSQQRSLTVMMREKDQTQSDHAKAVIAKSKLESLCRELQKQNKLVKDESIQRAKDDDEKRREISAKFQTTIGEIQTQMNNNNERNSKLQKENLELAGQLKKFVEQYENREQKMKQHRDLEQQVAEARLAQAKIMLKEEQERNGREKELLLMKAAEATKKNSLLEARLAIFQERTDEFETLQGRMSDTFQKYKTEMDKMSKRIKRLEKDGLAWKSKWEKTNKALIESLEARTASEKETTVYVQKTKKLESLCRALQAELHKDKVAAAASNAEKTTAPSSASASNSSSSTSPVDEVPPNSPETPPSSDHPSADTTKNSSDNLKKVTVTTTASSSTPASSSDTPQSSESADAGKTEAKSAADPGSQSKETESSPSSTSPSSTTTTDGKTEESLQS